MSLIGEFVRFSASTLFLVGLWVLFTKPQKSANKVGSQSTIHTFKNYFAIVFLAISFQFLSNKRYPMTKAVFMAR